MPASFAVPALAALIGVALPALAAAQSGSDVHGAHGAHGTGHDPVAAEHSVEGAMAGRTAASAHMALTPRRPANAADSGRAAAIADTLRRAIARYQDVRVAEREGYRIFAPSVPQPVYHFTHYRKAAREHFRFDPADPSSLLYRKTADGRFVLVGAMYVAPKDATPDELDARVPLSVARWHAHTNICLPPLRDARERWAETRDGRPLFGPKGSITTEAACDEAGGRFHRQLFGWMVHANVFAGGAVPVWGETHEH